MEVVEERTVSSVREIAQQFGALYQPLFAVKPVSKKSIANNITTKNDSADDECVKNEKKTMTKKFHKSLPKHRIKGIKPKTSGEPTTKSNSSTPSADYSTATIDSDKPDQSIIRDSEVQSTYGISKLSDKNVESDKANRSVVESDKNKISNNNAFDNDMKDDDLNAESKCDTQENEQCFESNYDNLKCSDDVALPIDISEDNRGITENLHKNNPDESEEEEEE
ncbi:unnamed protein product, partial [Anisakis simplex]|uniref:Nucleolin-like n=1 Tax=Anisakis simplex TaxID=6269 RepID=A0A0M3JKR7_ANISI